VACKLVARLFIALAGLWLCNQAAAWGTDGHAVVGALAVEQLSDQTRLNLRALLGSTHPDDIARACDWPDWYRNHGQGAATAPWHFVNIDPESLTYSRQRDCPDGECLPEALRRSALELADTGLPVAQRRQAFAFLCHLTGDLHQPLHVGYADDQGGKLVSVYYLGQRTNLHQFWDIDLITVHAPIWQELQVRLQERPDQKTGRWSPGDIGGWTNEAFTFTRNFAYPSEREVDATFEARSWQVVQQQLDTAAGRLAAILESLLGKKN
jgi:hypothetical protein